MNNWDVAVEQLVRKFHESVTNFLTEFETDCQHRNVDLTVQFIDTFYELLEEK